MFWLALNLRLAAVAVFLPWLAVARPGGPLTGDSSSLYSVTGKDVLTNDLHIASAINGQHLLPYNATFWFGLPRDYWCKAPQPGKGTNFTCTAGSYQPLYTLDRVFALATSYANPSITISPAGVMTYPSASAITKWTITGYPNDPAELLAYEMDATYFACPEQLDGNNASSTAYQVVFDTANPEVRSRCVQISLEVQVQAVEGAPRLKSLPYMYV